MADRPNTWAEVIRRAIAGAFADVHTTIPGKVVRVNMDGDKVKSVDVQPLIKRAHLDEKDQRVVETLPVIPSVPVMFYRAGRYRITLPITTSTTGAILFSEASLDTWLAKGGTVDPGDDRRFSLADAMFYPGLCSPTDALKSAPTDRMTIGDDNGLQIHIDGSKIKIGSNVDLELEAPVLEDLLKTYLSTLRGWMAAHVHTATAIGAPTTPPTVLPVPSPGTLGSGSVRIKKT